SAGTARVAPDTEVSVRMPSRALRVFRIVLSVGFSRQGGRRQIVPRKPYNSAFMTTSGGTPATADAATSIPQLSHAARFGDSGTAGFPSLVWGCSGLLAWWRHRQKTALS